MLVQTRDLYRKAIKKWGKELQSLMCIEEMTELMKEICKIIRNDYKVTAEAKVKLAEEISDVEIMIEQLKLIYNIEDSVKGWKSIKLRRLEQRLEEA